MFSSVQLFQRAKELVRDTFCDSIKKKDLLALCADEESKENTKLANEVMRYFHVTCATAVAVLKFTERIRFLGNVDKTS